MPPWTRTHAPSAGLIFPPASTSTSVNVMIAHQIARAQKIANLMSLEYAMCVQLIIGKLNQISKRDIQSQRRSSQASSSAPSRSSFISSTKKRHRLCLSSVRTRKMFPFRCWTSSRISSTLLKVVRLWHCARLRGR